MFKDGDLDLNASPKALDKLLGHLLAFKVKIQLQYKNSVVLKCSTDLSLINDVLDMFPDVEVLFNGVNFVHYCYIFTIYYTVLHVQFTCQMPYSFYMYLVLVYNYMFEIIARICCRCVLFLWTPPKLGFSFKNKL